MTRRTMRLPKDQLVEPEDRMGPGETSDDDVEGHGLPLTPPPLVRHPGSGHGGEAIPPPVEEDDVEGHRLI